MAGDPSDDRLRTAARDSLRAAIEEAAGSEVFLVGRVDEELLVERVQVHARGHETAAPALLGVARPGEVVIHNHPSGDLRPSDADLSVASALGNMGVGFYIVDNAVESVYAVVEPHRPRSREAVDEGALEVDLGPAGPLGETLDGYEHRESQVEMARAVARAFDEDGLALIEAGTGTGKSLAYLFPSVRFAKLNDEKVVVSTNTINLQTQLLEKDVPQVARALGEEVRAVLLKGRTNYICRRKLAEARGEPGLFERDEEEDQLARIADFARTAREGSRQELGFVPSPEIWERIQSESDTTLRVRCPHYNECFFYESRRRAAGADVIVSNHHLMLSDARLRRELGFQVSALLPPYKRLVIDEAHHLEDAATEHMSEQLSRLGLLRILHRLASPRRPGRGRIPNLVSRLVEVANARQDATARKVSRRLSSLLASEHSELLGVLDEAFLALEGGFVEVLGRAPPMGREVKRRVVAGFRDSAFFREVVVPQVSVLASSLSAYADVLGGALHGAEMLEEESFVRVSGPLLEARSSCRRIEEKVAALRFFLAEDDDQHCRWIELKRTRRGSLLRLCASPVEVGAELRETLFEPLSSAVMTSATLRTGEDFDYVQGRLGLADGAEGRLQHLALASPFDYETQCMVAVPTDVPLPSSPRFPDALAEAVAHAVEASRGRAFVLFTSYRLLNQVHDRVAGRLATLGLRALKQGSDDRHRLLERFKADVHSVLFATSSFWEGVDVPGDALRLVVLTRLPFAVPDDPVLQARAERITARGGDAFTEYSVPQAVLRFRQGFGRLIRRRDDRGVVLITDRRVIEKRYGKTFLDSLPVPHVHCLPMGELGGMIRSFLDRD